jgi:hypothetical protein
VNLTDDEFISRTASWDVSRGSSFKNSEFKQLNLHSCSMQQASKAQNPNDGLKKTSNNHQKILGMVLIDQNKNNSLRPETSKFRNKIKRKSRRIAEKAFYRRLNGEPVTRKANAGYFKPSFSPKDALVLSVSKFGHKRSASRRNNICKTLRSQRDKSREMSERLMNNFRSEINKLQENMSKSYFRNYDL